LASGVDTSSIVEQLMALERQSVTRLKYRQSAVTAQQSALKDIASKLSALKTSAETLSAAGTWKQTLTAVGTIQIGYAFGDPKTITVDAASRPTPRSSRSPLRSTRRRPGRSSTSRSSAPPSSSRRSPSSGRWRATRR
jgi:Flagellar hook-associated protein 2 N-terminus